jgi:hypothetical protein
VRTNDILSQIDSALGDHTISGDAMRSRPGPAPAREMAGAIPTVQIMDETGEWQEIPGVASIEIQVEIPAVPDGFAESWAELRDHLEHMEAERVRRAQEAVAAFGRYMQAMRPALERAARRVAEAVAAMQQQPPVLPVRRDRPAWQSPYGPSRRR